jgi:hypothetical protein
VEVELAGRKYELHEQGVGRIRRKLTEVGQVFGGFVQENEVPSEMGDALYDVLKVFIPELVPIGELLGYASQAEYERDNEHRRAREAAEEAWQDECQRIRTEHYERLAAEDADEATEPELPPAPKFEALDPPVEYVEKHDVKPTEIAAAVEKIFEVHGGQRLVRLLKSVFGPETLRSIIRNRALEAEAQRTSSRRSPRLPQANGGSPRPSSSTPGPQGQTNRSAA